MFEPMFVHGFGHLVDRPVLCLCLSTEMAFWWMDRCLCLCLSTEFALLVDGPVFELVFIHGNGFLVDSCKALGVDMRLWLEGNGVPDAVLLCLPLPLHNLLS